MARATRITNDKEALRAAIRDSMRATGKSTRKIAADIGSYSADVSAIMNERQARQFSLERLMELADKFSIKYRFEN